MPMNIIVSQRTAPLGNELLGIKNNMLTARDQLRNIKDTMDNMVLNSGTVASDFVELEVRFGVQNSPTPGEYGMALYNLVASSVAHLDSTTGYQAVGYQNLLDWLIANA